ncbi:MAG: hypothetical protein PHE83_18685 [Opitutaceae bacterium]|nr:hypothetical protein [Opitutaceae bacterium]
MAKASDYQITAGINEDGFGIVTIKTPEGLECVLPCWESVALASDIYNASIKSGRLAAQQLARTAGHNQE